MVKKIDVFVFIVMLINFPVVLIALYDQNWFTVALNGGLLILLAISTTRPRVEKKEETAKLGEKA